MKRGLIECMTMQEFPDNKFNLLLEERKPYEYPSNVSSNLPNIPRNQHNRQAQFQANPSKSEEKIFVYSHEVGKRLGKIENR